MMNEHTWSQTLNITQQPAAPDPVTVPVNVTLPAPVTAKTDIVRVLAIIAGVFFLVGAGFFLLTHIIE